MMTKAPLWQPQCWSCEQLPSVQTREFAPSFVTITASKKPKYCQLLFLTANFTECSVLAKPLGQN